MQSRMIFGIGGAAALVQLTGIVVSAVIIATFGDPPQTALDYFAIHARSVTEMFLRSDFVTVFFFIVPYLATFPAIWIALRDESPALTAACVVAALIVVTLSLAGDPSFSLHSLATQYAAAADPEIRAAAVAAATAQLSGGMWQSTAAFASGILLQGSGMALSLVMLKSRSFHKLTAWSGLAANAMDLLQHVAGPFIESLPMIVVGAMGIFYTIWFLMLAVDLLGLARNGIRENA